MTRREELKNIGFSDEEIDRWVREIYDREKEDALQEIQDAKIAREKVIKKFLYPVDTLETYLEGVIHKMAYKAYLKSLTSEIPEFTGDRNNPAEVWEYNQRYGIKPIQTIDNNDGTFTHIYEDGTKVIVKVKLSGIPIPSEEQIKEYETNNRRLLAEALDISEEDALNMEDNRIKKMILKKEKQQLKRL